MINLSPVPVPPRATKSVFYCVSWLFCENGEPVALAIFSDEKDAHNWATMRAETSGWGGVFEITMQTGLYVVDGNARVITLEDRGRVGAPDSLQVAVSDHSPVPRVVQALYLMRLFALGVIAGAMAMSLVSAVLHR